MADEPTAFQEFIQQHKDQIAEIEERLMNTPFVDAEPFNPEAFMIRGDL
jgi:hypothetical protein